MLKRNLPVTAALALSLVLAAGALVAVLFPRAERIAGTNTFVEISGAAVPVAPGRARCAEQNVPGDATSVRVYPGTRGRPGPPFALSVRHRGRTVAVARAAGGYADNAILVLPLSRETSRWPGADVCLRNLGRGPLQFAGNSTPRVGPALTGPDEVRTDWLLPGRRSWAGMAGKVAERFTALKPGFVGPWGLWALAAALAALWALAFAVVVREARR